jgi:hypothetical protein
MKFVEPRPFTDSDVAAVESFLLLTMSAFLVRQVTIY